MAFSARVFVRLGRQVALTAVLLGVGWSSNLCPLASACQPRIQVLGDHAAIAEVVAALARYRSADDGAAPCGTWLVTVAGQGGPLTLRIENGEGLSLVRRASNGAMAAALIDSWVHHALGMPDGRRTEANDRPVPAARSWQRSPSGRPARPVPVRPAGAIAAAAIPAARAPGAEIPFADGDGHRTADAASGTGAPVATGSPATSSAGRPDRTERELSDPRTVGTVDAVGAAGAVGEIRRTGSPLAPLADGGRSFSVLAGPELTVASDRSRWTGGRVAVCWAVGRFCGGLGVIAATTTVSGVGEPDVFRRNSAATLASLALPVHFTSVVILPEVGLGVGLMHSTFWSGPANPGSGDLTATATSWGPWSTARITLVIPIGKQLAMDVSGALDGVLAWGNRTVDADDLPAEPRLFLKGAVALRYRAP